MCGNSSQLLRGMESLSRHITAHELTKNFLASPQSCYIIRLIPIDRGATWELGVVGTESGIVFQAPKI